MTDSVNNPSHYNQGKIECIDAIKSVTDRNFLGYLQGNALKYVWRCLHKENAIQDIDKAIWYLNKMKEELGDGN
jgi:hypothetical protein